MLFEEYLDGAADLPADDDYDLHYDQRQNGTENYRLNVDGVIVAVPAASENSIGSIGMLATNYLMDFAAGTTDEDDEVEEDNAGGDADKPYQFEVHQTGVGSLKEDENGLKGAEHSVKNNEKVTNEKDAKKPILVMPMLAADGGTGIDGAPLNRKQVKQEHSRQKSGGAQKRNK